MSWKKVIQVSERTTGELKTALRRHYAAQRTTPTNGQLNSLVVAMLEEDAKPREVPAPTLNMLDFVAAQVHYVPAWSWLAQIAVLLIMAYVVLTTNDSGDEICRLTMSLLTAASVLVGVPSLQSSKQHGVVELEYSCKFNTASIVCARLIIFGCTSALVVALMVLMLAARFDVSLLTVTLWAAPPYFISCAGVLAILRIMSSEHAALSSVAFVFICFGTLLTIGRLFPDVYKTASLGIWALAAGVGAVWLAREIVLTVRSAAAGLDAYCPAMKPIFN